MRVLLAFASVEGHTKKIAVYVEQVLREAGCDVARVNVIDSMGSVRIDDFDVVVLAASVHRQRHPKEFEKFLRTFGDRLQLLPALFFSVSLCAAFPSGQAEATSYVRDLAERTGYSATSTALIGGALQFSKYQDFERQVVRLIGLHLKQYTSVAQDAEFTDWALVRARVVEFLRLNSAANTE